MEKKVLVIGGGVIGLSSAICLLEDGWDVRIHSAEFSPNTTSDVAAALWYPFLSAPVEKTDAWGSRTYDILKLLTADEKAGIEMVQTYEYFRSKQEDPSWMSTVDKFERITEDLPSDYVECFSFMTQVIEMPIYLNWLMDRFKVLGGKLEKQMVKHKHVDLFGDRKSGKWNCWPESARDRRQRANAAHADFDNSRERVDCGRRGRAAKDHC